MVQQVLDAAARQFRLGVPALGKSKLNIKLGVFDELDATIWRQGTRAALIVGPRRRVHGGIGALVELQLMLGVQQQALCLHYQLGVLEVGLLVRFDQRQL